MGLRPESSGEQIRVLPCVWKESIMDTVSTGLLRMISMTGGLHAGHDADRKRRLDEMVTEGLLSVEQPTWQLPDTPAQEPTYRLTEKGKQFLA
jgi:hypothetical protein